MQHFKVKASFPAYFDNLRGLDPNKRSSKGLHIFPRFHTIFQEFFIKNHKIPELFQAQKEHCY